MTNYLNLLGQKQRSKIICLREYLYPLRHMKRIARLEVSSLIVMVSITMLSARIGEAQSQRKPFTVNQTTVLIDPRP